MISYFYSSKNNEKMYHSYHKTLNINFLRFISIKVTNQDVRMISDGSCDTEDWINAITGIN